VSLLVALIVLHEVSVLVGLPPSGRYMMKLEEWICKTIAVI
jgi:hypothetical protein